MEPEFDPVDGPETGDADFAAAALAPADGASLWDAESPSWGIWGVPESVAGVFPAGLDGCDAIELGCGPAHVSAWMTRRGARVVATDPSARRTAEIYRMQARRALPFRVICASGDEVPLPDGGFDFAVSEYGACLRSNPYRFVPEAWRLLRPGGRLSLLTRSWVMVLCSPERGVEPVGERLVRPGFGVQRLQWPRDLEAEFHLSHSDWIRLFRSCGFEIEDLVELRAPKGARQRVSQVTADWARRWPSEEIWKVRKRAGAQRR